MNSLSKPFLKTKMKVGGAYYKLVSFVVHKGSQDSGHWLGYHYCSDKSKYSWYKVDDLNVTKICTSFVDMQGGFHADLNTASYATYIKCDGQVIHGNI